MQAFEGTVFMLKSQFELCAVFRASTHFDLTSFLFISLFWHWLDEQEQLNGAVNLKKYVIYHFYMKHSDDFLE